MAKFPLALILLLKSILTKGIAAIAPYYVTNPRYTQHMAIRRPLPPPSGMVERVRLLAWPRHMDALSYQVGTIEGMVGDDVLVSFGEVVVHAEQEISS